MSPAPLNAQALCRRRCLLGLMVALLAMASLVTGLRGLTAAMDGLEVLKDVRAGVPITLYRPVGQAPAPVVVVAHGFAGSQQMMQPYAVTLARDGYIVVTFDFAGHGRNPSPFVASLLDREERLRILLAGLEPAIDYGLAQPGASGQLALVGHSMAGDVLARYAGSRPGQVSAMVLLSPYISEETETAGLPNLLLIYGALEPEMLHRQGLEILSEVGGDAVEPGTTYGSFQRGNARRLLLAQGLEHIGVLYGEAGLAAARDWLDEVFAAPGSRFVDRRGASLALLYLGLIALAWPLSLLLPRVSETPRGSGLRWRQLLPVAAAPAVLTPLILWKAPTDFLPILIADYLALHFAVYGLLTALGLWLVRRRGPSRPGARAGGKVSWRRFGLATLAVALFIVVGLGLATDRFVTSVVPVEQRWPLAAVMLIGTGIYFLADEWLTRGPGAATGGYAVTKLFFLLSLLLAVGLNLSKLFFLIIIVPAILILFVVYGLFSGWASRSTGHPWVAALPTALAFAVATTVTFPIVMS